MKQESAVNANSVSVKTYIEVKIAEFVLWNVKHQAAVKMS
jgi:hypothetical protein